MFVKKEPFRSELVWNEVVVFSIQNLTHPHFAGAEDWAQFNFHNFAIIWNLIEGENLKMVSHSLHNLILCKESLDSFNLILWELHVIQSINQSIVQAIIQICRYFIVEKNEERAVLQRL